MNKYTEDVITAFLTCSSIKSICEATGKSERTIIRYSQDEELQKEVDKRRKLIIKASVKKMQSALLECVEELLKIVRADNSPQIKINAMQLLFNQCRTWTEDTDIIERLQKIEDSIAENDSN